ncbi:MAG: ATP-binding protein [Thermodesulfobacteriota bacterium]
MMARSPKTLCPKTPNKSLDLSPEGLVPEIKVSETIVIQSFKNNVISALIPGFIHQINNPINNIILTLDTLMEDNMTLTPEERSQLFQEALGQANRAVDLIKTFDDFYRDTPSPENGQYIEALVDKAIRLLNHELKKQHVKIIKEISGTLPSIGPEKTVLWQVLVNLMLNSIQAMPNGGQIKISLYQLNKELRMDISDNGTGISPVYLKRIFEPYFSTKESKIGLGLPMSLGILKKIGGWLKVKSSEGRGATFSLGIPLEEKIAKI